MPDNMLFLFGLFATIMIILVGHWLPWPSRLPRILAYSYGLAAILAGLAIWLLAAGQFDLWLHVCAFVAAAGVATISAYAYDTWRNHEIQQRIHRTTGHERREQ